MPRSWHPQAYAAQAVAARSYALASLHPGDAFDLYADTRDQVYGGIAAERAETNAAVGATAGRVLTYGGRVITAYYGSSSGGRTAAVQDVLHVSPEPYLVAVRDPFDALGPHHSWRLVASPQTLSARLGMAVSDVRVELNSSGRVSRAFILGGGGQKVLDGRDFMSSLGLQSTFFSVQVLSLDEAPGQALYGEPLHLHGFLRGIGGVVLQEREADGGWRQVGRVLAHPDGRFDVVVRPRFSTSYRLAVDRVPGPEIAVDVARRIAVHTDGSLIAGHVLPAAPLRVERKTARGWLRVGGIAVGPSGAFRVALHRAGSYRVASGVSGGFLASASVPVSVSH
jgi:SpoIID/LytB domain protein